MSSFFVIIRIFSAFLSAKSEFCLGGFGAQALSDRYLVAGFGQ